MLRLRFSSGVILGLVLGIPAGAVIALLLAPASPSSTDHSATATSLQIQELTHKLEAAKDDRQRADKQLDQFQKLAEQMTGSFNNLEQRFKALQEEQHLQEVQSKRAPAAVPPAPVAAVPAPAVQPAVAPAATAAPAGAREPAEPADDAAPAAAIEAP